MKKIMPIRRLVWVPLIPCVLLLSSIRAAPAASAATDPRRIEVTAKRFEYVPSEVTLKKGEPVVLVIHSADVAHGLKIQEFNIKADIAKGGVNEIPLTPAKSGTFVGHCSHFCGSGHGHMTLTLHVTE